MVLVNLEVHAYACTNISKSIHHFNQRFDDVYHDWWIVLVNMQPIIYVVFYLKTITFNYKGGGEVFSI